MRFYEDLNQIQKNRLPQRAYYIPENSVILLNGEWNFKFFEADYDECQVAKWDKIEVPSCWQLKGYEKPYYVSSNYPYPVDPPYVPDVNPMGVYMREFVIGDLDKKHYMVFEGVSSNVELYINNEYVGYSQGSHMQAEFDISDFVKIGTNTVIAKVRKWCSGSYLEDQDFFRYNGIFMVLDVSVNKNSNNEFEYSFYLEIPDTVSEEWLVRQFEYNCSLNFTH